MDAPKDMEALRTWLTGAVDQLLQEFESQRQSYRVPADNLARLLEATAEAEGRSAWETWRTWALRHLLPVHWAIENNQAPDTRRLRDLLGYAVLGLYMAERSGLIKPPQVHCPFCRGASMTYVGHIRTSNGDAGIYKCERCDARHEVRVRPDVKEPDAHG